MPEDITYAAVGSITKSGPPVDGVWSFEVSKATGPDLDLDGQEVDMGWAMPAMQEWFKTGGNIREQHDPKRAVGKALTLEEKEDGSYIAGKIVDRDAGPKLEHGIFNGLSVGIKGATVIKSKSAPNGRIVGGKIVEVSLVDRPANPTAKLVLAKAAGADGAFEAVEELVELAERVDHSHSHNHSEGHHKHVHVHGPDVAEHRALDSGVPHNHNHSEEQSDSLTGYGDDPSEKAADIEKAKLKQKERDALDASDFALPDSREYPIQDESHARAALSMLHNASPEDQKKIKAAVHRRYPDIGSDDKEKGVDPLVVKITLSDEQMAEIAELVKGKPIKPTKSHPDPDGNGDNDLTPEGDTDHDYWNEDGTLTDKGKASGLKPKSKSADPDIIKATVAEATSEIEAKWSKRVEDLETQMAEILKTPIPGAVTRTRPTLAAQVSAERAMLEQKRERLMDLAANFPDQDARKGYAEMVKETDAEIKKLAS
jgi:hypothetical protein